MTTGRIPALKETYIPLGDVRIYKPADNSNACVIQTKNFDGVRSTIIKALKLTRAPESRNLTLTAEKQDGEDLKLKIGDQTWRSIRPDTGSVELRLEDGHEFILERAKKRKYFRIVSGRFQQQPAGSSSVLQRYIR